MSNPSNKKRRTKTPANLSIDPSAENAEDAVAIREPKEDLVVFAFRLTAAERELIHKAAGAAKASRFVRTLAVAAARGDETRLRQLLEFATQSTT